jgi:hypothetical protein
MHGLETIIRLNNEATAKQEQRDRAANMLRRIGQRQDLTTGDRAALHNLATDLEKGKL